MLACVFFIGHSFEFAVKHPELLRYYQFSDNYVLSKNREQNRFKIGIIDGPINLKHPELEDVLIEQSFFVNDYTENDIEHATSVFCKSFIHNIAKKKYITLQPEFFFNYFDFDNAFLSLKLSPVKLRMCA